VVQQLRRQVAAVVDVVVVVVVAVVTVGAVAGLGEECLVGEEGGLSGGVLGGPGWGVGEGGFVAVAEEDAVVVDVSGWG
jgi:hypothetical protein